MGAGDLVGLVGRTLKITKERSIFTLLEMARLQNSPYFCVFKYARAVKQKVWNEAENRERDWGELSPHTPYGRVRLARLARVRLLRHALPISLLTLRKKPTVLQSKKWLDRRINCTHLEMRHIKKT